MIKNLPAKQETWIQSLVQEDPLEKGMASHCYILAWEITWTEEPDGLQSIGLHMDLPTKPPPERVTGGPGRVSERVFCGRGVTLTGLRVAGC